MLTHFRWDFTAQLVVGDLAGAVTSVVKAAIPSLVSTLTPLASGPAQGKKAVGWFLGETNSATQPQGPVDNTKLGAPAADDYAAITLKATMIYFDVLNAYINGPGNNVNWEKARGDGSNGRDPISFVAQMLREAQALSSSSRTSSSADKVSNILLTTTGVRILVSIQ